MSYQVAIDGPAGAGKSTIARQVAKNKGFIYVDTGAMYRAMALHMIRSNVDIKDAEAIAKASETADISIQYVNGEQIVLLNGENVNGLIRADENDVIMDGRDIGTCVLPNADVKVYLTASSRVRAQRRYKELAAKGESCDLDQIETEIKERDHRDMTREHAPLRQAADAQLLDSSDMSIGQVVDAICKLIHKD